MVCDAVYFNPHDNFKQWYTPYENENQGKIIFRLNAVISTNVEVKPINDVDISTGSSDHLTYDAINLSAVYVCNYAHDEILEKNSRE